MAKEKKAEKAPKDKALKASKDRKDADAPKKKERKDTGKKEQEDDKERAGKRARESLDEVAAAPKASEEKDEERFCKDCSGSFVYTVKEQRFNKLKGFAAKARCADCSKAKKAKWATDETSGTSSGTSSGKSSSKSNEQTRCFNCGKTGHVSAECSQPQGSTACFHCGKEGHLSRACPTAPQSAEADPATAKCFNCAKIGHLSKDCPQPKNVEGCYKCGKSGHSARTCRSAPAAINSVDVAAVELLIAQRKELRQAKDWEGADAVKQQLKSMGITVEDHKSSGPGWYAGSKPRAGKPTVGACFLFPKGECNRGATCHFSHTPVDA